VVEPRHVLAARLAEPAVERRNLADVPLVAEHADAGVAREGVHRAVGARVVHEQELEVAIRLRENALDRLVQIGTAVVDGEEDGDAGTHRPATDSYTAARRAATVSSP
jgi:hypothetical protein